MSDYIPEDIQLMILKHLPVITLLRFRCVCKWWKQVIDSQTFILDHLATQDHSKPLLILEYEPSNYMVSDPWELMSREFVPFDIIPSPTPDRLRLLGTLHGIVCLYCSSCKIILWNPWTRKLMTVGPRSPCFDWYDYEEDQFSRGPSSGFWIDPSTKEFKVIMLQLSDPLMDEENDDVCEIYSSVRGDWKKIPIASELEFCYTLELTPSVVIGNVGHWTVYYDKEEDMIGVLVVLFDFKQEVFLESIYALGVKRGWNRPVLCERDGDLSLVYMDPENSFDIFSRKEGKWVLVHGFFIFPCLERIVWREGDAEDKRRKTRALAAITGGLLSFEPEHLILTTPMMIKLTKATEIVVANSFVASLLFPSVEC